MDHSKPKEKKETFTAYPNRYLDRIKPTLSATQKDLCDLVIRLTYGWHRSTARISNREFMKRTGRSERAIIAAKKELAKKNLLKIETRGGGAATGEYWIDIYMRPKETPEMSQDEAEISNQEPVPESSSNEDSEASTPEENAAVPGTDPGINIYNKKQTEAAEDNKAERKKAIDAVCYLLKKYGFRVESENYGFIGWAIKAYGADMVNHKLSILKFQLIRGVKVHNAFAWLRRALTCDYDYSGFDMARVKAEEKAQKRQEYSQAWLDDQVKYQNQVQAERADPEARERIAAAQAAFWQMVGEAGA